MRSVLVFAILVLSVSLGCGKKISNDEVVTKVAQALCDKMKECAPQLAGDPAACLTALKAPMTQALQKKEKKDGVKQKDMESCLNEIKSIQCATFSESSAPTTCAFFKN